MIFFCIFFVLLFQRLVCLLANRLTISIFSKNLKSFSFLVSMLFSCKLFRHCQNVSDSHSLTVNVARTVARLHLTFILDAKIRRYCVKKGKFNENQKLSIAYTRFFQPVEVAKKQISVFVAQVHSAAFAVFEIFARSAYSLFCP